MHPLFRFFGICILLSIFSDAALLESVAGGGGEREMEKVPSMRKSSDGRQASVEYTTTTSLLDSNIDDSGDISQARTPRQPIMLWSNPASSSSSSSSSPSSSSSKNTPSPYLHPNNNRKRCPGEEQEKMREQLHHSHAPWGYCAGQCKICRRYPPEPGLMQVVDCKDADLYWLPAPEEEYRLCPVGADSWINCIRYDPKHDDKAAWKAWVEADEKKAAEAAAQQNWGNRGVVRGGLGRLWRQRR